MHEQKGLERWSPICPWLAKSGKMMRDAAVCSLWWKFILHSSAFPTRASTPFRVHYAKSITFAFSLCVEPLNSIAIACCHDNTIMHFFSKGEQDERHRVFSCWSALRRHLYAKVWRQCGLCLQHSKFMKTDFYSRRWFGRKGRGGMLNLSATFSSACPCPPHTRAPAQLHLWWTGSLSAFFITVSYCKSAKLSKLTGMCVKQLTCSKAWRYQFQAWYRVASTFQILRQRPSVSTLRQIMELIQKNSNT